MLLVAFSAAAFAADTSPLIYGETVNTQENEIIFVPVNIKNNSGLMGFKLTVKYDPSVLTCPCVSTGKLTQLGILNDSVSTSDEGKFDILWSSTGDAVGDGTLAVISFNTAQSVDADSTLIKLSYSKADTFNEKWEEVKLDCSDITVSFKKDTGGEQVFVQPKTVGDDDIVFAVESALGQLGITDIGKLDGRGEELLESVNLTLLKLTGSEENKIASIDSLLAKYSAASTGQFVNSALDSIDAKAISNAVESALGEVGASSVDKVGDEDKEAFITAVEDNLRQFSPDVRTVSGRLGTQQALDAVKRLQEQAELSAAQGKKIELSQKGLKTLPKTGMIIGAAAAAAVIAVAVLAFVIKRKAKKATNAIKEDNSNEENG